MGKGLEQTFPREDIQMAYKHIKIRPTVLVIREIQIKPPYAYQGDRNKKDGQCVGKDVGK